MKTRFNALLTLVLLALIAATPGCIKYKQALTLMPDGSGKVDITWAMSDQLVEMAKQQNEDPFEKLSPDNFKGQAKGIAAFTEPKREKKDGYSYLTYTAYFQDINAVSVNMNQKEENADGSTSSMDFGDPAKYTYQRDGDTATLTIENGVVMSMVSDYEPTPEEQKAQMRQMMVGFEISEQITLPGTFKDVEGVTGVDNSAILRVTLDDALDGTGPLKDLKDVEKLTFTITDITVDDAAVAAFKKEMQAAVEAANDDE